MGEYSALTSLADVVNVAASEGANVATNLVHTAGASETVTAAVVGGLGYYGYKKKKGSE